MPVTGNILSRADLLTSLNADIKNAPATLIRGDVLAQKMADLQVSAINNITDYSANNSIIFKNNAGVITNLVVAPETILGRDTTGEIAALTVSEVNTLLGAGGVTEFGDLTDAYALAGTDFMVPMTVTISGGPRLIPVNIFEGVVISVDAATTAALPAVTYANGASGVGATLTGNANGAFPTVDGVAAVVNQTYLVKNQAAKLQNGAYQLTTLGDGSNPFVLTRLTSADATAELDKQGVVVAVGTANGKKTFTQQTASPVVGTDNIDYKQGAANLPAGLSTETLRYNSSNVLVASSLLTNDGTNVGIGVGATIGARFHIKGVGTSTGVALLITNSTPTQLFKLLDDGTWALGSGATLNAPQTVSIGANANPTSAWSIVVGSNSTAGSNSLVVGILSSATGQGSTVIGELLVASNTGSNIWGGSNAGACTNDIPGSFMLATSSDINNIAAKNALFVNFNGNILVKAQDTVSNANIATLTDRVASNTLTIHDGWQPQGAITVTSVTSSLGALFNYAATSLIQSGDAVITSGFGVYANQLYYIRFFSSTTSKLYSSRANALSDTSPVAFISTDTGTITPGPRSPVTAITGASQLFSLGGKLSALNADGETGKVAIMSDNNLATYSGTITWTAGTAPSGTLTQQYAWTRIGNTVEVWLFLKYTVAGATCTIVTCDLPAGLPNPAEPVGLGAATDKLWSGDGYIDSALTGSPPAARAWMRVNAADTGWQICCAVGASASAIEAAIHVRYRTA